ncbi:hypothetical protein BX666DRAFT_327382 [Dichotomocladium elegans]|nr:hypothetical protein BX666DRAFT_327382 [Dichotomocladium elegans]
MMLGTKADSRSSIATSPNRLNLLPGINSSGVISPTPRFSVYSGPEPTSSSSASIPPPSATIPSSTATINASRRPENQIPVSKFAGTTLPQKPYARPEIPKFQVFRDEANQYSFSSSELSLTERFIRIQSNAIHIKNSKGADEYISATTDCLSKQDDDFTSFEELRARHYAAKANTEENDPLPESGGFHEYVKPKLQEPPADYTTETIAAMQAVESLFSKGKNMSVDDDEVIWSNKRQRTKYHDENEGSHLADRR